VINGSKLGSAGEGINLATHNSVIRGLVMNGFGDTALALSGGGVGHNVVAGNYFGTDVTGTNVVANQFDVLVISQLNTIGGYKPRDRNLLDGATYSAVDVTSYGNTVPGNYVGVDVTGTKPVPNNVGVELGGATLAQVGGSNRAPCSRSRSGSAPPATAPTTGRGGHSSAP